MAAARILVDNTDRAAFEDENHIAGMVRPTLSLGPQRSLLETLEEVAEVYSLGQIASEWVAVTISTGPCAWESSGTPARRRVDRSGRRSRDTPRKFRERRTDRGIRSA